MEVEFQRTGARRYAIAVRRPGYPDIGMNPAPGYDPLMPHDMLHLVVEAELRLDRGVFGQLAAGGDAGTFGWDLESGGTRREATRRRRRTKKRGAQLARAGMEEAAFSERAGYVCLYEWLRRTNDAERRQIAATMRPFIARVKGEAQAEPKARLDAAAVTRICDRLDELSEEWATLEVGQSMTVPWSECT